MPTDPSEMSTPRLLWESLKELLRNPDRLTAETADGTDTRGLSEELQQLDYADFERLMAAIYEARGYDTELTRNGADRGVDVFAHDAEKTIAIQAKRYSKGNRVGSRPVRAIVGAAEAHNADQAAIATTSAFTDSARGAGEAADVTLIDGERCAYLLENSPPWVWQEFRAAAGPER